MRRRAKEPKAIELLVVDDRHENLVAIESILASDDYKLVCVTSGAEALRHLLERDFAAILIDVVMPEMDGFELATLIKQRERSRLTPIIFLTASDQAISYRGYSVGAVDYLLKPLDPDVLRAKVSIFVELFRKDLRILEQAAELRRAQQREREHEVAALRMASEARYRNLAEAIPQIVWTADPDGSIGYFNHRWYDYTGDLREPAIGAWRECIAREDLASFTQAWAKGIEQSQVFELEVKLRRRDGHLGWHLCRAVPEYDPSSRKLVGWLGTFTDCDALKRAADTAKVAVRARDEFLSIASHELRTPLTTLGLRLDGLAKELRASGAMGPASRIETKMASALRQTGRLVTLVDSLLNVSRITGGRLVLQPQVFDMIEAIRDVIDRIAELATGAGVTVSLDAAGPIVGRWDRLRIEQIVDNLLVNAIKYAAHAPVEVTVAARKETVEIAVQDHGPGIPDAEQERIFGPFERAVSSRNYGGLGLGLFIARQNALAHGGSLRLTNAEPGAKFVVELPWPRPTA